VGAVWFTDIEGRALGARLYRAMEVALIVVTARSGRYLRQMIRPQRGRDQSETPEPR
jgi:hypothetical protein